MDGCLKVVGIFFVALIALSVLGNCMGGGTARNVNVNNDSVNVTNVNSNTSNASARNYNSNANSDNNSNSNVNAGTNTNTNADASNAGSNVSDSEPSESSSTNSSASAERVESAQPFVANANTKVFHYASCSYAKRIKEANKIEIEDTYSNVLAMGYTPCDKCNPHKSYY